MEELFSLTPLSWTGVLVSIGCGTIIGIERQIRGKPVGIRTSSLIVLGTYIFVSLSVSVNTEMTDTSRIIGQVVTGIGFLGAGVMMAREGAVVGVTSAATIWVLAAIGVVIALAEIWTAIKLAFVVVFILVGVDFLEDTFTVLTRGVHRRIRDFLGNESEPD